MAVTTRQIRAGSLFVLLLIGTLVAFGPVILSSRKVRRFCDRLPAGTPAAEVQTQAAARGYTVTKLVDGSLTVESSITLGRVECQLEFDPSDHLISRSRAR